MKWYLTLAFITLFQFSWSQKIVDSITLDDYVNIHYDVITQFYYQEDSLKNHTNRKIAEAICKGVLFEFKENKSFLKAQDLMNSLLKMHYVSSYDKLKSEIDARISQHILDYYNGNKKLGY